MARMTVYLPEELHRQVKDQKLPVSAILQAALQHELMRRDKIAALDEYLAELDAAGVGEPTDEDRAEVERIMSEIHAALDTTRAS